MDKQMPNRHMDALPTKAYSTKNYRQTNRCAMDRQSPIKGQNRLTEGQTPDRQTDTYKGCVQTNRRTSNLFTDRAQLLPINKLFGIVGLGQH